MSKTKPTNPTPEDIQEWKAKHKDIYRVTVDDSSAYIRKPSRKDIAYSSKASDFVKGKELIAEAVFLGGDPDFLTDDEKFFALSQKIDQLTAIKEAEIEKL